MSRAVSRLMSGQHAMKILGAMDRPHYLATAGVYAVLHQEMVEVDALVAQRIHSFTLITTAAGP